MKFILGFIVITLISLTLYVYMGSNGKQHVQKEATEAVQAKEKVFETVPTKIISKKVTHSKVATSKHEVASSVKEVVSAVQDKVTSEVEIESKIGKDLTIESIENADVSDEQKELLYSDLVYRQSFNAKEVEAMSEEEALSLIERDVENGILE